MKRHAAITILTLATAACAAGQTPATPSASVSAGAPSTAPTAAPSPSAPATAPASPSAQPSAAASELEGLWSTPTTTCEQQNAALTKAGFTADELHQGGWDPATCSGMSNGSQWSIRFAGDQLVIFQDGVIGWRGATQWTDPGSFDAGEHGNYYASYGYLLDGDTLTVDMVRDDYPTNSKAELLGEHIAQTVVYETAPFTRGPAADRIEFASSLYPYRLLLPEGWSVMMEGGDTDQFERKDHLVDVGVGSGHPEPGQTVEDRVRINRADEFAGCDTDPSTDHETVLGGERAIAWRFTCGTTIGRAVNTIHDGVGYRVMVQTSSKDVDLGEVLAQFIQGFAFTN